MSQVRTCIEDTRGEPARHRSLADLEAGLRKLPPAPTDFGRLACIVRRPAKNAREILHRVRLSPEEGLPGDNWGHRTSPDPDAQLAVMQRNVAELVANGQSLALFGDNLFVDLDLSAANLPTGSRLRVGGATVEVTPMPHDGCHKFNARFGNDALRLVNARPTRHLNLRGIYWRVIEAGEIETGSTVQVLSRAKANPWLEIPLADYEAHMALPAVGQAKLLGSLLQRSVAAFNPGALAVFGVAGGNGLEHIDSERVSRVVALDLNPEYLNLCTQRHGTRFAQYEPVLHDLSHGIPDIEPVDLVFAGLVLEYLDTGAFLQKLPRLLTPGGVLAIVLQLPSPTTPEVTPSPYKSLGGLQDVFRFVDPAAIRDALCRSDFSCCEEQKLDLETGKSFHYACFRLNSP
jgi:MOSC domain-containing protein YiiM